MNQQGISSQVFYNKKQNTMAQHRNAGGVFLLLNKCLESFVALNISQGDGREGENKAHPCSILGPLRRTNSDRYISHYCSLHLSLLLLCDFM